MTDEELLKITESMQKKLGEENSAVIADDFGSLITANSQAQQDLLAKNEEIKRLQDMNAKLIASNGALLKQVPAGKSEVNERTQSEVNEEKEISCTVSSGKKSPSYNQSLYHLPTGCPRTAPDRSLGSAASTCQRP